MSVRFPVIRLGTAGTFLLLSISVLGVVFLNQPQPFVADDDRWSVMGLIVCLGSRGAGVGRCAVPCSLAG